MITNNLEIILIVSLLLGVVLAFVLVAVRLGGRNDDKEEQQQQVQEQNMGSLAEKAVEHIFNTEFREELRNRGRLRFEKVIGENAMFLQQDLRLTTSQVNELMQREITKTLREAFEKYEESIQDAKELALESINKTKQSVEEQRELMKKQLSEAVEQEKKSLIERFEDNMGEIVNHYVVTAIGGQISLDDQLEYILSELENNKKAIIEDLKLGA